MKQKNKFERMNYTMKKLKVRKGKKSIAWLLTVAMVITMFSGMSIGVFGEEDNSNYYEIIGVDEPPILVKGSTLYEIMVVVEDVDLTSELNYNDTVEIEIDSQLIRGSIAWRQYNQIDDGWDYNGTYIGIELQNDILFSDFSEYNKENLTLFYNYDSQSNSFSSSQIVDFNGVGVNPNEYDLSVYIQGELPTSNYSMVKFHNTNTSFTNSQQDIQSINYDSNMDQTQLLIRLETYEEYESIDLQTAQLQLIYDYGFQLDNSTSNSIDFYWNEIADADEIKIQIEGPHTDYQWEDASVENLTNSSATVINLDPDTGYRFRLVVIGGIAAGESAPVWYYLSGEDYNGEGSGDIGEEDSSSYYEIIRVDEPPILVQGSTLYEIMVVVEDVDLTSELNYNDTVEIEIDSQLIRGSIAWRQYNQIDDGWDYNGTYIGIELQNDILFSDFSEYNKENLTLFYNYDSQSNSFSSSQIVDFNGVGVNPNEYDLSVYIQGELPTNDYSSVQFHNTYNSSLGYSQQDIQSINYDPNMDQTQLLIRALIYEEYESIDLQTSRLQLIYNYNFQNIDSTSTSLDFVWSEIIDADEIKIQIQGEHTGWIWEDANVNNLTNSSATVTNLEPDMWYSFRLVVIGGIAAGESDSIFTATAFSDNDDGESGDQGDSGESNEQGENDTETPSYQPEKIIPNMNYLTEYLSYSRKKGTEKTVQQTRLDEHHRNFVTKMVLPKKDGGDLTNLNAYNQFQLANKYAQRIIDETLRNQVISDLNDLGAIQVQAYTTTLESSIAGNRRNTFVNRRNSLAKLFDIELPGTGNAE
jgi:thiamine kinase-like enzyme